MELSLKHRNIKCSRYSPGAKLPCYFPGFTFKHFLNEINAVEVIIGICNNNCICAINGCYQSTELVRFLHWLRVPVAMGLTGAAPIMLLTRLTAVTHLQRFWEVLLVKQVIVESTYKFDQISLTISLN